MIRTEDKLARKERSNRGTVFRKAMRVSRNHPIVFLRNSSACDLFKFFQIYADHVSA